MSDKREQESSLELLLDTMCNTFGAVVFIAISLTILISMTSKVQDAAAKQENIMKMKQELADVTKMLNQLQQATINSRDLAEKLKNDPRRDLIAQKILLEQARNKALIEIELKRTQHKIVLANLSDASKQNQDAELKCTAATDEAQQLEQKNTDLEQRILQLNEKLRKTTSYKMSFIRIRESKLPPYFLIVKNNVIYRVGPDKNDNFKTSDDVRSVISGDRVTCVPNENAAGIPMLDSGGNLSPQFYALMNSINAEKRVPKFAIHADSLTQFCKFRALLKQRSIQHGVGIEFNLNNEFTYIVTKDNTPYEY